MAVLMAIGFSRLLIDPCVVHYAEESQKLIYKKEMSNMSSERHSYEITSSKYDSALWGAVCSKLGHSRRVSALWKCTRRVTF